MLRFANFLSPSVVGWLAVIVKYFDRFLASRTSKKYVIFPDLTVFEKMALDMVGEQLAKLGVGAELRIEIRGRAGSADAGDVSAAA